MFAFSAKREPRRGFTLFEVIVALSLSLLLAAAVWEALQLPASEK